MVASGTGSTAAVVLRLPPSAAHVRTARLVAAAVARRSGVDEELLDEVRLAVGEACARAVRLHERHSVDEPVTVEFADRGRFAVSVIDRAPVTAPSAFAPSAGDPARSTPLAVPRARADAPWTDPSGEALGLALLDAVAWDLSVTEGDAGTGTRVAMSWPLEA